MLIKEMKAKQQVWEKLIPSSKEELRKNAAAVTISFSETHLNTTVLTSLKQAYQIDSCTEQLVHCEQSNLTLRGKTYSGMTFFIPR
jgi:hypothetical protein